jgi:hypothetical protein
MVLQSPHAEPGARVAPGPCARVLTSGRGAVQDLARPALERGGRRGGRLRAGELRREAQRPASPDALDGRAGGGQALRLGRLRNFSRMSVLI